MPSNYFFVLFLDFKADIILILFRGRYCPLHMMAVASSIYCAAAAPPGLLATLNGPVGSFHYSFCRFRITLLRYSKKLICSGQRSRSGQFCRWHYDGQFRFEDDISHSWCWCRNIVYFLIHRFSLAKIEKHRLKRKSTSKK